MNNSDRIAKLEKDISGIKKSVKGITEAVKGMGNAESAKEFKGDKPKSADLVFRNPQGEMTVKDYLKNGKKKPFMRGPVNVDGEGKILDKLIVEKEGKATACNIVDIFFNHEDQVREISSGKVLTEGWARDKKGNYLKVALNGQIVESFKKDEIESMTGIHTK